jgi:hypothetical protein
MLKMFQVTWFDAGNCEIAAVRLEATSIPGAYAPAYHGLNRKQFAEVQSEAVRMTVEEV